MRFTQTSKFLEKFTIKNDLMGLAIGSHGSNITKARQVPGVTNIEIEDETCTFKVSGDVSNPRCVHVLPCKISILDRKSSQRCTCCTRICGRYGNDSSRFYW